MAYKLVGTGPDIPVIGLGNPAGKLMLGRLDVPAGVLVPMLGPAGRGYHSVELDGNDLVFTGSDLSTETVPVPSLAAAAGSATAAATSAGNAAGSATAAAGSATAASNSATAAATSKDDAADLAAIAGAAATAAVEAAEEAVTTVDPLFTWTASHAFSSAHVDHPAWYKRSLGGNATITFPNGVTNKAYTVTLEITQDATGGRTLTFVNIKWPFGTPPTVTTTPSARDIFYLTWTGSIWVGSVGAQAVA